VQGVEELALKPVRIFLVVHSIYHRHTRAQQIKKQPQVTRLDNGKENVFS
jgi:hypothetical protein